MGAPFSNTRVANEVACQWMRRTRVLYDTVKDARGELTKAAKRSMDVGPQPGEAMLKVVHGAHEAWIGLRSLEFKVHGSRS